MKLKVIQHSAHRIAALLVFLILSLILLADSTSIELCNWEYGNSEVLSHAQKQGIQLLPVDPNEISEYDNYILKYLLSVDKDSLKSITVFKSKNESPYRDFLLFRGKLSAVSCRNEPSSMDLYQKEFALLKKHFGSPETKRTETSVTHTFTTDATTVLFIVKTSGSTIASRTYYYPTDLFRRILFPLPGKK